MNARDPQTEKLQAAASVLAAAWRDGRHLAHLPSEEPATVAAAYDVQNEMVRLIGPAGGWKVSPLGDGDPRCCPLPAMFFHDSPAELAGLSDAMVEAEIAVRFGRDLPARSTAYTLDEVASAIAAVHPAIEIIGSRFADRAAQPSCHTLADLQNCAGVVVGPGQADWRSLEIAELAGQLVIDGTAAPRRGEWPGIRRTLEAVTWLVGHAHRRGTFLAAGHVVITGARIGPSPARPGAAVAARFEGLGDTVVHL